MLVRVNDVTKTFITRGGESVLALSQTSLDVIEGEFLSLIGPSGCGKSTLLRMLAAELMARGNVARQLTELVKAMIGHHRGGLGLTTVAAAAAFGSVSGSAPATVAALGRARMPWKDRLRVIGRGIWALGLPVVLLAMGSIVAYFITLAQLPSLRHRRSVNPSPRSCAAYGRSSR